ncbi:MAG TPA: homoserine kinase [Bacillota bacterium]|nr:homoserine kinase [Bacillota bacterium]
MSTPPRRRRTAVVAGPAEVAPETAPPAVVVSVPATSANLGPGFDTLGLALELRDRMELVPGAASPRIWSSRPLPGGDGNLALRAARRVCEEVGAEPSFLLRLHLQIPVGRGLGSSAAAIVGGLMAANAWLGSQLGLEQLLDLATEIEGHPDNVAPALMGGLCVACRGEDGVTAVRLQPPRGLVAALAIPDRSLPTAAARRVLPARVPFADAVFNVQRAALLVAALSTGRTDVLAEATRDRLHQPHRLPLLPGLAPAIEAARTAGAAGAFLSGAGPAVLALCAPEQAAVVAQAMASAMEAAGQTAQPRVLSLAAAGARIEPRT